MHARAFPPFVEVLPRRRVTSEHTGAAPTMQSSTHTARSRQATAEGPPGRRVAASGTSAVPPSRCWSPGHCRPSQCLPLHVPCRACAFTTPPCHSTHSTCLFSPRTTPATSPLSTTPFSGHGLETRSSGQHVTGPTGGRRPPRRRGVSAPRLLYTCRLRGATTHRERVDAVCLRVWCRSVGLPPPRRQASRPGDAGHRAAG